MLKEQLFKTAVRAHATLLTIEGPLSSSSIWTGTEKLAKDASSALLIVAPTVGIACIIYFAIRKSTAEEQEVVTWKKRIQATVVCMIIAFCASGLVQLVTGYYGSGAATLS